MLAMAIIFVTAFSLAYIVAEAGHECTENDCPICSTIEVCENTIRLISSAITIFALIAAYALYNSIYKADTANSKAFFSPVTLKVKLLN